MYHPENRPAVTEKQMVMSNWLRRFWEMGYTPEETGALMADLYGPEWEASFPGGETDREA